MTSLNRFKHNLAIIEKKEIGKSVNISTFDCRFYKTEDIENKIRNQFIKRLRKISYIKLKKVMKRLYRNQSSV